MPTYIDIHDISGLSPEDIAKAHERDMATQGQHGVYYVKYWMNMKQGKLYCLCNAPSAEAADRVHHEAHGFRATRILEVTEELAEAFMGDAPINSVGAAIVPGTNEYDPGTRTIMFTDIVESTNMTQRLGDELAFARLEVHDRIVREHVASGKGREVKHTPATALWRYSRQPQQRCAARWMSSRPWPATATNSRIRRCSSVSVLPRASRSSGPTTFSAPPCSSPPVCARTRRRARS